MKEDLILIGGGGHCKSCIDVIETEGRYNIIGIVDVAERIGDKILGYEIIADDSDLDRLAGSNLCFHISLGYIVSPERRIDLFNQAAKKNAKLPVIISPKSYVSKYADIGDGTIIMHGAVINSDAKIGENCIINTRAIVEHDAVVSRHCHISTGAVVNGAAEIGEATFIGSNSVVRENIKIGKHSIIGCGLRVTTSCPDNSFKKNNTQ